MKALLALSLILSSSPALANNEMLCHVKQKNAASLEIAQLVGVPVQNVEVTGVSPGPWTEMVGNNTGSDRVTVRVGNRLNRGMTIKEYDVIAQQIGTTDDCKIIGIQENQH